MLIAKRLDSALFQSIGIFSDMLHAIHKQNIILQDGGQKLAFGDR